MTRRNDPDRKVPLLVPYAFAVSSVNAQAFLGSGVA